MVGPMAKDPRSGNWILKSHRDDKVTQQAPLMVGGSQPAEQGDTEGNTEGMEERII